MLRLKGMSLKHKRGKRINYNYKVYNGYFYSLMFIWKKMLMFTVFYLKNPLTSIINSNDFQKKLFTNSNCFTLFRFDGIRFNT